MSGYAVRRTAERSVLAELAVFVCADRIRAGQWRRPIPCARLVCLPCSLSPGGDHHAKAEADFLAGMRASAFASTPIVALVGCAARVTGRELGRSAYPVSAKAHQVELRDGCRTANSHRWLEGEDSPEGKR